ncbi:RT0821/Lpp0805 family surface protein [Prosthecodimorpha staleyi]|uniref:Surface antigen domain-containing protein n=1 Tax=Prosthecodimorpha staleyi TaxID=2840188 RepID=A0A947GDM0_9HYPH|nr:RT0821/Lpp0805 family surface protein [Prosthecodimorpha staleyi]MBT9288410.1 hypothetical protein [Prosthecodimorpha staleyi]
MAGRVAFYTRVGSPRQCAPALLICSAFALGACSAAPSSADLTGSIPTAAATTAAPVPPGPAAKAPDAGAKPSDWEAVRRSVARAEASAGAEVAKDKAKTKEKARIEWANAETGNSGTISDVIASGRAGGACKGFNTTVSSVDGVRLYRGQLCRRASGWELTSVEPADSGRM